MPTKTVTGKTTLKTQRDHGLSEALLKLFQLGLPWLGWIGLTIFGLILRLGFARYRLWSGLFCLAACAVIACFDLHLRMHRRSIPGRFIGPVTALGTGLVTALFIWTGFHELTVLMYFIAGAVGCVVWDIWIAVGDHRDLVRQFAAGAEAAGVPGAQLTDVRSRRVDTGDPDMAAIGRGPGGTVRPSRFTRRRRPGPDTRPEVIEAGLVHPSDPAMTSEEIAGRTGHIEGVLPGTKPGSWTVTQSPDEAGYSRVKISDPDVLTGAPLPWPGPYAPGADMSVPFRLGMHQDSRVFFYPRLKIHHRKVTGKTGSGKTESLAWNMFAEGITREGYAAIAFDLAKGDQYLGALRPSLHVFETDPDAALARLAALHRTRLMRCNYLARVHLTEWEPGCGLSFLDVWIEEAPALLKLLGRTRADAQLGIFMLEDWVEDVNTGRSAGESWTASFQKPDKTQAVSTVARSQMGSICFGVDDKSDAEFGLSELQRERGCRPQLWQATYPGMAYWDTETIPDADKALPMRHWHWGPGSARIAAYAAEWPAADRPLDDVTGEGLFNSAPGPSPSSALPAPGAWSRGAADLGSPRAHDNGANGTPQPGNGTGSTSGTGKPRRPTRARGDRPSQTDAEEAVRRQILAWKKQGRRFFRTGDLQDVVQNKARRTRTWVLPVLDMIESEGLIKMISQADTQRRRYEIAGVEQAQAQEAAEAEMEQAREQEGGEETPW